MVLMIYPEDDGGVLYSDLHRGGRARVSARDWPGVREAFEKAGYTIVSETSERVTES